MSSSIRKHRKPLRLGMPVYTLTGRAGVLIRLITDPESREPTYLVVKTGRLRWKREILVPVSLVSFVGPETVGLNVTKAALASLPDYETTLVKRAYKPPAYVINPRFYTEKLPLDNRGYMVLRQRNVPDQAVAVEKNMPVRDLHGRPVGKVEGVILDRESREGKYILFRRESTSPLQLIPADLVQDVSSGFVMLYIDQPIAEDLPTYSEQTMRRIFAVLSDAEF